MKEKKQTLFKSRARYFQPTWRKEGWNIYESQCPVCKRWFGGCYESDAGACLRMHVSRVAKNEAVAKSLGELKKIPHFDLWKKCTQPIEHAYRSREWIIL